MADPYSLKQSRKSSHRPKLPNNSYDYQNQYTGFSDYDRESERQPKKQRIANMVQEYGSNSSGGSLIWGDQLSFLLLDVWGERFLQLGRRSLRSEDWSDVAERVSVRSRTEVTDVDCRKQLDALKRKYRKITMDNSGVSSYSWKFYKKMEMLMGAEMEENGLACGVDSGEYCFADTRVYLDRSNAFDEMRDSPSGSEIEDDDEEEEDDDMPPKGNGDGGEGMRVLADSIERFGKLYEEVENNKWEQMMELKKMRADFDREMELQKKEILEKACAEIAKIQARGLDDDDDDENEDDDDDNNMEDYNDDGGVDDDTSSE